MWDKIKEFFGIETKKDKQKKEEEIKKKQEIEKLRENEKELFGQLEEINKEWLDYDRNRFEMLDDILPKELDIELKEYTGDSVGDINKKVNEKYGVQKQEKVGELETKYDGMINGKHDKKESAKQQLDDTLATNSKQEIDTLEEIRQRVAQRGLARSSIKNSMDESAKKYFESKNQVANSEFDEKIKELNDQISMLQNDKKSALTDLDIAFAKQIDDEIKSLVNKRANEIEKIEKYNAEQKDKALKYKQERAKKVQNQLQQIAEIRDTEAKNEAEYGYKGEKLNNYEKRLDVAVKFYSQLPKEYAREMISKNPMLKKYLGRMYGKLLSYIG